MQEFLGKAEEAMLKELKQIHDHKAIQPILASTLAYAQKAAALELIMTVKLKRDVRVKGQHCANGGKQREYTPKEDATSPTVGLDSVLLLSAIGAHEGCKSAVVDLLGAYLHANYPDDKEVIMTLRGRLAKMMVMVAPEIYCDYYMTVVNGKKVLYVKLKKALYGLLKFALLFYRKFWTHLSKKGFELNPYDPCVVNKMVKGKQMPIC